MDTLGDVAPSRDCRKCHKSKDLNGINFPRKKEGFGQTCLPCTEKEKQQRVKKKEKDGGLAGEGTIEEKEEAGGVDDDGKSEGMVAGVFTVAELVELLATMEEVHQLEAIVDLSSFANSGGAKEWADKLSKVIWNELNYRWM